METPEIESILESKLPLLPTSPGVYLFRDKAGEVIYVGKAKTCALVFASTLAVVTVAYRFVSSSPSLPMSKY